MGFSKLAKATYDCKQRSPRQGERIVYFIVHGMASTSFTTVRGMMLSGSKQVSANYIISNEGVIEGIVDELYRAWTSGSSTDGGKGARFDRQAITVEVENATAGPSWGFSALAEEATARLLAEVASRNPGIRVIRIQGVLGHRELWTLHRASYPTACPQSFNLDGMTRRAQALSGTSPVVIVPAGPDPVPDAIDYAYGLTKAARLAIQKGLARLGRYKGDQDGIFHRQSVSALQQWLRDKKYLPAGYDVDGVPGPAYGEALHDLADKYGYTGTHVGLPGAGVSAALVKWAKTLAPAVQQIREEPQGRDWSYWEPRGALCKRVQRGLKKKGRLPASYKVDGIAGQLMRKAIQTTIVQSGVQGGVKVGSAMDRNECYGIQKYAAKFGDYDGPVDGDPREASWTGFALGLERP